MEIIKIKKDHKEVTVTPSLKMQTFIFFYWKFFKPRKFKKLLDGLESDQSFETSYKNAKNKR